MEYSDLRGKVTLIGVDSQLDEAGLPMLLAFGVEPRSGSGDRECADFGIGILDRTAIPDFLGQFILVESARQSQVRGHADAAAPEDQPLPFQRARLQQPVL